MYAVLHLRAITILPRLDLSTKHNNFIISQSTIVVVEISRTVLLITTGFTN